MMLRPTAIAFALCLGASGGFAADAMSKADHKAAKTQIDATYKSDKAACDKLEANAKDVCAAQAKGKQKVAHAELEAQASGKASDQAKVPKVKADQDYAVAKEKCEDKAVADKGACKKEAKAMHDKAMAEVRREQAHEKSQAKAAEKNADRKASAAQKG